MATIGALMRESLVTATGQEPVASVAKRMADAKVGAVLIVDGESISGVFSERDLLTRVVAAGLDPAATKVGDVATAEVVTVERGTHVKECAGLLTARGIRHLPVVEDGRPVGMVSARDFFEQVVSGLEPFVNQSLYERALASDADPYGQPGGSYGQ